MDAGKGYVRCMHKKAMSEVLQGILSLCSRVTFSCPPSAVPLPVDWDEELVHDWQFSCALEPSLLDPCQNPFLKGSGKP